MNPDWMRKHQYALAVARQAGELAGLTEAEIVSAAAIMDASEQIVQIYDEFLGRTDDSFANRTAYVGLLIEMARRAIEADPESDKLRALICNFVNKEEIFK